MSSLITPLHNNILVKLKEHEKQTSSGLILVQTENKAIQEGFIVALPESSDNIKVKVGDRILFAQHAGTKITVDGELFLIMEYEEILALLPPEEAKPKVERKQVTIDHFSGFVA